MQRNGKYLLASWLAAGAFQTACEKHPLPTAADTFSVAQYTTATATAEPFFSEYVEGTGNNKALEMYNGTGAALDLAAGRYSVQMFFNGSASAGLTIDLTGTVPDGDVFVLAHSSAHADILAHADQTNDGSWFDGNDAVVLARSGIIVDVIGQIGFQPGTEWGSGLASTADNTLRRRINVCEGDRDGTDAFVPGEEWDGYVADTYDGLGSHACIEGAPSVVTTVPLNGGALAAGENISVTFSERVDVAGDWFELRCTDFEIYTATVAGGPRTFTLNPDADLPVNEGCILTVFAAAISDRDGNDPPDNMEADFVLEFAISEGGSACVSTYTPAYSIQGSGLTSPLAGTMVTTQGVVVGDYEGPSPALRGFYLQDAAGDRDPATSDAVFVFNGDDNRVSLGDVVRVSGIVQEFQGQTQIGTVTSIEVCSSGNTVAPVDVMLPLPAANFLERYEGMLVRLPQTLYVTEHFQLGRFGQVVLSSGSRLLQPTAVVARGAPALAMQAANDLNRIILDDDLNNQNPDPILFGRGGNPLSAVNTLRGGDAVTAITGVLTYTWAGNAASANAYRVRIVNALAGTPAFVAANPRPPAPEPVGGSLRVAALNLLNYFNTFSGCSNGVGGAPTDCRGAENAFEFDRQSAKTVAAIQSLDADIVGLIELENDGYDPGSAIADLVDRLNAAMGPDTYVFIDADAATNQVNALGLDAIKVGLIYKPASVTPVGSTAVLNSIAFVNAGDRELRNRASLAQAFEQSDGGRFIVNVNHLKSKGSACDAPDAGDGQGNCNSVRTNAVDQLLSWLASDPTRTLEPDVLIVGDMNAYAKEDPISALVAGGYTDLIGGLGGVNPYSFVFDGQWGYLDHALGSNTLVSQVTGVTQWHINADEPAVLDYNTNFKSAGQQSSLYSPDMFRMADHDPVVVGLSLRVPPVDYEFSGFFKPVASPPVVNVMKPGRAVPVTFSLGGNRGLDVFDAGYPKSVRVACDLSLGTNPIDLPAETAAPGQSSLSYDAATDTYTYVWKTEAGWANTCRELIVRFRDETIHRAVFRFDR